MTSWVIARRTADPFRSHHELLTASFTPQHNPTYAAKVILSDKLHPLHQRSMDRFRALPRNMLWVHVVTNPLPYDTVRRRGCRRMIEAALSEALRNAKFDLQGILWAGKRARMMKRHDQHNQHPRLTLPGVVTGTLEIWAKKELLYAEQGKLEEHMRFIVRKLKEAGQGKQSTTGSLQPERARTAKSKRTKEGASGRTMTLKPDPNGLKFRDVPTAMG